jgi:hypothetical protein
MAIYEKASGAWVDAEKVNDGTLAKLVNEVEKKDSRFKDEDGNAKTENVGKVRFQGGSEPVNVRLNWTTIYGLIDAFGKDSKEWIGKTLTVRKREMLVGDTARDVLYFIPEGFELVKNAEKKLEIRKVQDVVNEGGVVEEINPEDIPF